MRSKGLSRREFLKWTGVGILSLPGLSLLPKFLFKAQDQTASLGLIRPREALFYKRLEDGWVKCELCPRECRVGPNHRGYCEVRENRQGKYYTLVYGNPCAVHIDPVEKKPFYHVLPQSQVLSIATAGCNFDCKYCQNWEISQVRPEATYNFDLAPAQIVALARDYGSPLIAYTYTEPSIFYEYMLDTARLARKEGILNSFHSNGYLNPKPLSQLSEYLDAANIDLKGFDEEFYSRICSGTLKPVLESLKTLKQKGVWVEITNLVVPTHNDDPAQIRKMCRWIRDELGPETPLHFSQFRPMYKLGNLPPTPVPTLKRAREIALDLGLNFVYIGNVYGNPAESTYCPKCGKVLILRRGYSILENNLKDGRCRYCGRKIPGIWKH